MNQSMDLNLHALPNAGLAFPVSGSVALAQGDAPRGSRFTLFDHKGRTVPVQFKVLARWPDGTARWVLLDFQARTGGAVTHYRLRWDADAPTSGFESRVKAGVRPTLTSNGQFVCIPDDAVLNIGSWALDWTLADARGKKFHARVESSEVESGSGPLRGTLALKGSFVDASGCRFFGWRLRVSLFAGLSLVKLEPMITVDPDRGGIQKLRWMRLRLRPMDRADVSLAGQGDWRVFQIDDGQYTRGKGLTSGHAPGHVRLAAGSKVISLALRDFWQRWPKGLAVNREGVDVEFFPAFTPGQFEHMQPWYKYDYLFDGACYRLKTGQARRWELWLDLSGGDAAKLAARLDQPPVLMAESAQAMKTGVWGDGIVGGSKGISQKYDDWVKRLYADFEESRRGQRDYGEMNFGDWFGERHVNWGNNEYDTSYELFFHGARMNDPSMHRAADAAARHASEVDVVHFTNDDLNRSYGVHPRGFPPRPGMMHEHCVGHVGGFHSLETIRRLFVSFHVGASKAPYLCLDPFNLGHIWTRGLAKHFLLTGDPWSKKIVQQMGDSLARLTEDGEYESFSECAHSGRVVGWALEALSGACELDDDKRYVRAMRRIVNLTLGEQDPNSGGWLYELPEGHCGCRARKHVGEAGFLTAIRINGLHRYFQLTGDKRIPEVIGRAVTNLNNDTWKEEHADWRYTSCPGSKLIQRTGVLMQAVAASVFLTGNPEHARILEVAWKAKQSVLSAGPDMGNGKAFTTALTGTAQTVAALRDRKVY